MQEEGHCDESIREAMSSICLSYDNMCHMDDLIIAREDLPLPKPFNEAWKLISKVIDRRTLETMLTRNAKSFIILTTNYQRILTLWHASKHSSGRVDSRR